MSHVTGPYVIFGCHDLVAFFHKNLPVLEFSYLHKTQDLKTSFCKGAAQLGDEKKLPLINEEDIVTTFFSQDPGVGSSNNQTERI